MLLAEFFDRPPEGYSEPEQDNSVPKLSDVRKTRLTLAQIGALRKMNDVRTFEQTARIKDVQRQYAAKPAA